MHCCCVQVETTKEWGESNKRWNLFITRFYDCELCDAGRGKERMDKCHKSYLEHYDWAFCRFHRCIPSCALLLSHFLVSSIHHNVPLPFPVQ